MAKQVRILCLDGAGTSFDVLLVMLKALEESLHLASWRPGESGKPVQVLCLWSSDMLSVAAALF
jgi:hypothetical protein